jgi:hypothetical protein
LRLGLALSFVGLVGLLAGLSAASASAATLPPQGIFETCTLDTEMQTCLQRLDVMHQGGIQVVVFPIWGTSLASLSSYASAAHALGMSVMWELGDESWWQDPSTSTAMSGEIPVFASACGCEQNGPLLAYTVQWLSQLPGTYGYYAADDSMLAPGDQAGVAQYMAEIKQQDPTHPAIIGSADESQTQEYQGSADAIGTEIYPVTQGSLLPVAANQSMWNAIGQEARDAQRSADTAGKQSAFILQAFSWGDNLQDGQAIGMCSGADTPQSCWAKLDYPSESEQLQLRNEVLRNAHPELIIWYSFPGTYGDVTGNTDSTFPTGATAAAHWRGLAAAVQTPYPAVAGPKRPQPHLVSDGKALAHADAVAPHKRHKRRHKKSRKHRHKKKRHKPVA